MPELLRYGLFCLVIGITNFQQSVTGFGASALALPFAILLVGLDLAKPVLVMLAWVLNLCIVMIARKDIVWREYVRILVLAGIGLPVGMWMGQALPEQTLKVILAVFMTGIGMHGLLTIGRDLAARKMSLATRMLVGGFLPLGGAIHGAFGSGGPLVVVYAARVFGDKGVFRVTLALVYLTLNSVLVASWASHSMIRWPELRLTALCLPFTLVGLFIGNHAHHRMNEVTFKKMVYAVLCASGAALAWTALVR